MANEQTDKKPGVIDRLVHHLQNGGGTVEELAAKLQEDFPERSTADGKGMMSTIRIQLGKAGIAKKRGHVIIKTKTDDGMSYAI